MESEGEHGFSEMSEEVLHHTTYDIHITHLIHTHTHTHNTHTHTHTERELNYILEEHI